MINIFKRGQSATEFIIIASFLLIIIIVIVSSLGYLPSIASNKKEIALNYAWEGEDLEIKATSSNSTHTEFIIQNNLKYEINIYQIIFDDTEESFLLYLKPGEQKITIFENSKININSVVIKYLNLKNNKKYVFVGFPLVLEESTNELIPNLKRFDPSNLVGYWNFDSRNSTHIFDLSENNNSGKLYGDVSIEEGVVNEGGSFDGSGDYVSAGSIDAGYEYTVAGWVKINKSDYADNTPITLLGFNNFSIYPSFNLDWYTQNKTLVYLNSSCFRYGKTANLIADGYWHFVSFTVDMPNGLCVASNIHTYVDGILDDSSTFANSNSPYKAKGLPLIGAAFRNVNYYKLNGYIDEVMIFDRALKEEEIKSIYEITKPD